MSSSCSFPRCHYEELFFFCTTPTRLKKVNSTFNHIYSFYDFSSDSNKASIAAHGAPYLSYESLDKFNCTSETLKISDDYHQQKRNIQNTMSHEATCEIISTNNMKQQASSPLKHLHQTQFNIQSMNTLMNVVVDEDDYNKTSSMRRLSKNNEDQNGVMSTEDKEVASNKQKLLSDWYYIKTSPKTKPTSPYERRKLKNFLHHPISKADQALLLHPTPDSLNNRSSNDKISSLHDNNEYIPVQKYRSNDYIENHLHQNNFHEEKSPLQAHKCFSMKYSRNPSGETKFGEMTSSSFEHVNVMGLYDNRFSESDLRDDDYVQSLRMTAARMRPSPRAPVATNIQESQVSCERR